MANENDIGGKVGLDVTNFKAGIAELNRQIKVIDSGFKAAAAGMDDWGKSEEGLQQRISSLNQMTDLQRQKIANLTQQYEKVAAEKGDNSKAAQDLLVWINKETASLNSNEKSLRDATKALDSLGKEENVAADEAEELQKSVVDLDKALSAASATSKVAAAGVAAIATASAGAVIGIVKLGNDSAKAMNNFQIQTGASAEEMEEFRDIAQSIYTANLGESLDDVARSMATVKQVTGQTGSELESTTKRALLLRDTFEFDVNESVRTIDTMMKQFGITSEEAYTLMAQSAQNGANRNGDLLDVLNEYAPQFKAMGYSAEDFANTLIEGAENGAFSMDKVGDAIKEFNVRIKDGSDSTYDALAELFAPDDIIEWTDALTAGGKQSTQFMELVAKVGEETASQMVSYLQKGGKSASDTFMVLSSIMGDGSDILDDLSTGAITGKDALELVTQKLSEIEDPLLQNQLGVALFGTQFEDLESTALLSLGNVQSVVDSTADTLNEIQKIKFNDLGSAMEALKRQTIASLQPASDAATEMIGNIVTSVQQGDWAAVGRATTEGLNNIVEQVVQQLPDMMNVASAIIGGLGTALVSSLPSMLPSVSAMAVDVLNMLTEMLITNGPILIQSAVSTIMTIIDGITNALPLLIQAAIAIIKTLASALIENLPGLIESVISIVTTLVDGILELLPELIPVALKIIVTLAMAIIAALPKLIEQIPKIIETIVDVITDNLPLLILAAVDIIIALAKALITNLPMLIKAIIEIVGSLAKAIISSIPLLIKVVPEIFTKLFEAFRQLKWKEIGTNIIDGIKSGITNAAKSLANAAAEAAKKALDAVKDFLGIHSPSRVMRDEVGKMIPAGVAQGILANTKDVDAAMQQMNNAVTDHNASMAAVNQVASNTTAAIPNQVYNFEGLFAGAQLVVRGDQDIKALAREVSREIYNTQQIVRRGAGLG